jgi:hypothetical protein
MVMDAVLLKHTLSEHFDITGDWHVGPDGLVNVKGTVKLYNKDITQLPVSFGIITGRFHIYNVDLENLTGAPHTVYGDFHMENCPFINTLVDAPHTVTDYFAVQNSPLQDLVGFPSSCGHALVEYSSHLPVLRMLQCTRHMDFYVSDGDGVKERAAREVVKILRNPKWRGKGKLGMLNCALELKKSGFEGNAKW